MRILGIDYGDARIGLALSDASATLCGRAWTLTEWNLERAVAAIADVVHAEGVERIVLGLPKNMDGTEGPRAEKSRAAIIQADEGVGHGADKEILLGKPHDILINAAEHHPKDQAGEQHTDNTHRNRRDAQHAVQLGRAAPGVFGILAAQILAGNDCAAGGQCGQDLDDQNVQAVDQRNT